MKPPLRLFMGPYIMQDHSDGTFDAEFTDLSPNSDRRLWWVSNNGPDGPCAWYGTLQRSETCDSPFDWHSHKLPKKLAAFLGQMVQHNLEAQL